VQGCPLAPYLFIIVGEVLNIMFKEAKHKGEIKGVQLLETSRQQIMTLVYQCWEKKKTLLMWSTF
jgi:hypothetical protein